MKSGIHAFFGDEFRAATAAQDIVRQWVPPEDQAFGLEVIDGRCDTVDAAVTAVGRCVEALFTSGFLSSRKVVWFRDVSFLGENPVGKSERVKAVLEDLAQRIRAGLPDGHVLVLTAPNLPVRSSFGKICRESGEVTEFATDIPGRANPTEAAGVLREECRKAGLRMDGSAAALFLERVGLDSRRIASEVFKLATYVAPNPTADTADVEAIVSSTREALAWDLTDAFGWRDLPAALSVLQQLLFQKESPIGLIILLERRVRELLLYREALDQGWLRASRGSVRQSVSARWTALPPEVESLFVEHMEKDPRKTHPFRTGLLANQAFRYEVDELASCRRAILDAHRQMVTGRIPEQMVLEMLLIRIVQPARARPAQAAATAGR